jgi:hypothetical protein
VDFLNFTCDWFPSWARGEGGTRSVALRGGRARVRNPEAHSGIGEFRFVSITYGDLTGDGREDALVNLIVDTLGTQRPFCVFVYGMEDATPKLLWLHESGGGADRGLRDAYIEEGQVVLEEYNPAKLIIGEKESLATARADTYTRTRYGWDGRVFKSVGSEELPNKYGAALYVGDHAHDDVGESPGSNRTR